MELSDSKLNETIEEIVCNQTMLHELNRINRNDNELSKDILIIMKKQYEASKQLIEGKSDLYMHIRLFVKDFINNLLKKLDENDKEKFSRNTMRGCKPLEYTFPYIEDINTKDIQKYNINFIKDELITATKNIDKSYYMYRDISIFYSILIKKNVQEIKDLLEGGTNVNITDMYSYTPLMYNIYNNKEKNMEITEMLIKEKADINYVSRAGGTALNTAILYNCLKTIEYLIKEGADVNLSNPLITASEYNRLEAAILLIKAGANVNKQDQFGSTALNKAVINNNLKMVELLLSSGANIDLKDESGNTVLYLAKNSYGVKDNQEIADALIRAENRNKKLRVLDYYIKTKGKPYEKDNPLSGAFDKLPPEIMVKVSEVLYGKDGNKRRNKKKSIKRKTRSKKKSIRRKTRSKKKKFKK